ncbi:MAG: hypothetical protein ACJ8EB_07920 [Allosphingosinicella sp.]
MPLLCLAFALTGCGREKPPPLPPDQLEQVVENVRVEKAIPDPGPSRLGPIAEGGVPAGFKAPPLCRLTRDGRLLLVARGGRALARIDGKLQTLAFGGPVDPEGGFFTAPGLSVSIGRHAPVVTPAEAPGIGWPVGVSVGGGAAVDPVEKIDAIWTCEL